eukprot:15191777-Heterocapsa_arctica.AAC.1
MESVDDDVRIVFSDRAEVDTEESKKRTPEVEGGLTALPRRVRMRLQPTTGCPACENRPFGVHNARCRISARRSSSARGRSRRRRNCRMRKTTRRSRWKRKWTTT